MIKIFRNIRQRLLKENKFSAYLVYAVGEIILVVIGILIALQINNWNEVRKESKKEARYLENLERDLENQLKSIDIQLQYERKYSKTGNTILNDYLGSDSIVFDSLMCAMLMTLTERKTFVRTDPTFEDLVSTGNLGLLKDNGLRNEIIEYYQELKRLEMVLQNNNTLHVDQGYAQKISDLVFVGESVTTRFIVLSTDLLKDPEREMKFINHVSKRTGIAKTHIGFMNTLRQKTSKILEHLKKSRT
jgi:hypothetical protein